MPRRKRGIAAAFARARAGDRRLAPWMMRHHDELLRELGAGRVEWAAALSVFARLCLTDEHGRPPDPGHRLADMEAGSDRCGGRPAGGGTRSRSSVELVRGVRLVAAPAPLDARPTLPPSAAPAMAPLAGTVEEATERIQSVLAAMGAARVPLPRQPSRTAPADARPADNRTPKT